MAERITTTPTQATPSFRSWPLLAEITTLARLVCEWQLWLVLGVGVVLWALAFQVPYAYELDFGGDRATQRRHDDEPFLRNWNPDPEPDGSDWLDDQAPPPFRWAYDESDLILPGLGGGAWRVAIEAAGQPTTAPTRSTWSDGQITSTVVLTQTPRLYQHVFTANPQGDLALHFSTPPYESASDPRKLGFVAFTATVESVGSQAPPPGQLGLLALIVGVVYVLGRRLEAPRHWAMLAGVGVALLLTMVLALWRIQLTSFTPALGTTVAACYPFALVLMRVPLFQQPGVAAHIFRPDTAIIALIVLGFAIRLGGMLHPHIIFSDIGLNVNNMLGVIGGDIYQKEQLPARAGGGWQPYPTGQYIIAAPLQLLVGEGSDPRARYRLTLQIVNSLLDSMTIGLIWLLLRRRNFSQLAALAAAALYLAPGSAFKSLSVGEFANISGQALAVPLMIGLGVLGGRIRERAVFGTLAVLMLLAFLGHSGVTISVVLLLGYLGVLWMLRATTFRRVLPLALLGVVVAALLGLFYHSAYLDIFIGPQVASEAAAARPDLSFLTKLQNEMRRVFFTWHHPVNILLAVLGLGGIFVVALRPRASGSPPGIWPLLVAWWGSVLLSLGMLAVRDQTVRWDLFIYPALCLGAGPLLDALWRRGRLAQVAVVALLVILIGDGLIFWITQIYDYLHV